MPELICQHCATSNPVHSEFQVFCQGCGKKLNGTYSEWKKLNNSGSFVQYLEHLQQENELRQRERQESGVRIRKSKRTSVLVVLLLAVVSFAGWYFFKGGTFFAGSGLRSTSGELLNEPWKRYTCGKFGLSVELPGKLEKATVKKEDQEETEIYSFIPDKGFQAVLKSARHKDSFTPLEEAVNEAVNEVLNQPGIAGLKYEAFPFSSGDVPGILVRGTLERDGVREVFYCAVFVKSVNTWQVQLRHLWGDENGAEAVDRVLDSIEINYFGTPA